MNKLPKFSINNHQFILVLFSVLLVMGIDSFLNMPRSEDPPIVVPGAVVTIAYPGASPKDLEELVVSPIEEKINELENIDNIQSTINNGFAYINISYEYGNYNSDDKFNEVVQQVNNLKMDLPDDIKEINFKKKTTTDTKILQLALSSDHMEFETMEKIAENLKRELEEIDGIKKVEITAVPNKQVKISLDMDKMVNMGITLDDVNNAINSNNKNIPGGELNLGKKSFSIQTSGSYNDLEEIRNTVVGSVHGNLVYLKDVGTINFEYEDNNYLARYNHKRSIFVTAEQKDDENILKLIDEAKIKIGNFEKSLPANLKLSYVHNQAESVHESVNGFIKNLIQGIVLVGIFILLAIGFKSSIVIIIAIPSSILIGLGFVDLAGYGLQNISIAALVIALGLLVDNSIVVIENVERFLQMGYSIRKAAIKGTAQVAGAITSSTLTTLAAFIPIAMMQDAAGDFIRSLPVTVVATLLTSLILALTVSPILISKFVKLKPGEKPKEQPLQKRMKKFIQGPYRRFLEYSLYHKKSVVLITFAVFASAMVVFFTEVGISFFTKAEKPQFMIQVVMPQGANIDETNRVTNYVESILDTIPNVKNYAANVGHGNPKVYYNYFPREYAMNFGEILVNLKSFNPDGFNALLENLRKTFSDYPDADIRIKEFSQGIPIESPIEIVVYGDDLDKLQTVSDDIKQLAQSQVGVINVENKLESVNSNVYVKINKNKAAMLGVPVSEIDKTVRICMNGSVISKLRNNEGEEYNMVMKMNTDDRTSITDFDRVYVSSLNGSQIPLSQLARIEFQKEPGLITHYNLKRSARIIADVEKGYNTLETTRAVEEKLQQYELPAGFTYFLAGEKESQGKSFGNLGSAAFIAVLVILAILVFQFHSFSQPFIIFTSVPMALIGSIYALLITGYTFSFTAFVGAVALIGIVINDAIVLIDFTNELRKSGKTAHNSLVEAAQIRFIPILITSVTTIGGLLPLTLQGGSFWGPLGWTIIGGLTFSTLLTLIVVPSLYMIMSGKDENVTEKQNIATIN